MLKDKEGKFKVSKNRLTFFMLVCKCLPAQMSFDSLYAGFFLSRCFNPLTDTSKHLSYEESRFSLWRLAFLPRPCIATRHRLITLFAG